jgi:flagellar biosynthesis chaperone FliJ
MAKKSVEELKAQYKGIQEVQSEMGKSGVSAKEPAMKQMAGQLSKLDKEIKKAERSR